MSLSKSDELFIANSKLTLISRMAYALNENFEAGHPLANDLIKAITTMAFTPNEHVCADCEAVIEKGINAMTLLGANDNKGVTH